MITSSEVVSRLEKIYEEIQDSLTEIIYNIGRLSGLEQDILHAVEFDKFNASDGYVYASNLQEARKARRYWKDRFEVLKRRGRDIRTLINSFKPPKKKRYRLRIRSEEEITQRLNSVNRTNMKFKINKHQEKMSKLFIQTKRG